MDELVAKLILVGVPGLDYTQSFAFEEEEIKGEIKKAVKIAMMLMEKMGWTFDEVVKILELSEAEIIAFRAAKAKS